MNRVPNNPRALALGLALATPCACAAPELGPDAADEHGSGGVGSDAADHPLDDRPVVRSAKAPPVVGGTLLVTADQAYAVASDPARDVVHVVDLATFTETATIALEPGARPFRAAQDGAGLVHITLRGTGETVVVDPVSGQLVDTVPACPNPRGIAYQEATNAMLVACAGGELVHLDADNGDVLRRDRPATDLRDVFVYGDDILVTRFRSAEVLVVGEDGTGVLQGAPLSLSIAEQLRSPGVAWRTLPTPGGGWLMLHQLANTTPLMVNEPDREPAEDEESGPDTAGYGGGGSGPPCSEAVTPALSAMRPDGTLVSGGAIASIALAVDAAISPDGRKIVVASPSQAGGQSHALEVSLMSFELRDFDNEGDGECAIVVDESPSDDFVAVAFVGDDTYLAQTRAQPQLYRFDGAAFDVLELAGESVRDTGHELFHLDAGQGISCASCHPEAGDDGRLWTFSDTGRRRTQPLNVGLAGTQPFHWGGEMEDMSTLVHEVRGARMGGEAQTEARTVALQEWIFAVSPPNPTRDPSDVRAQRGKSVFGELGCDDCHAGRNFTSSVVSDFGKGPLQVPSLRGVALRPPFMHDARSADLDAAVRDMIVSTPGAPVVGDEDVAALVAYLETL